MTAKKDGKALQLLVRAIESAIAAGNANISIEMSKRFPDKVTGKPREHDVVLTIRHEHHQAVIALECRDRSRPVGVEAVEAFHSKCQHTGIHSAIIVSARGFYQTAIKKAAHYNIRCLRLDEVESFDWCLTTGVGISHREIRNTHLNLFFAGDETDGSISPETIQLADGTPLNGELIGSLATRALNQYHPIPAEEPGKHRAVLCELNPPVFGIKNGKRVQAAEARFTLDYTFSTEFRPLSFRTYLDVGTSKEVSQVAVCPVSVSTGEVADLVLSTNDEGLIKVALIRSPPALGGPSEK